MEVAHSRYIKKKKRITLNGFFYAIISSCSFGFSPLFSLGLLAKHVSVVTERHGQRSGKLAQNIQGQKHGNRFQKAL